MITINRTITREETLWIPELTISGKEGNRIALISIPVSSGDTLLDPITAVIQGEDFNEFYENYTNDKYLIDYVLTHNNIEADTSDINDFTN